MEGPKGDALGACKHQASSGGRFRGPVLGAGEPLFWRPRGRPPEAGIYWKGYNFYEAEAHARGRPLVRINMDETSVPVVPAPLRGVVMRRWRFHTLPGLVAFALGDSSSVRILPTWPFCRMILT